MPFQNVTNGSGISYVGETWSAAWGDVNGDGRLDLWISKHNPHSFTANAEDGTLYVQNPNGTFSNATSQRVEYLTRDFHGSAFVDFDNDGDQDLSVVHSSENGHPITLYQNVGGNLADVAPSLGFEFPDYFILGRNGLWLDYNRDGNLDFLLGVDRLTFVPPGTLVDTGIYRQTPQGEFVNANAEVGLTASSGTPMMTDLNGDGSPEVIFIRYGSIGEIFNVAGGQWQSMRSAWLSGISIPQFNDAVIADFNNDGRNDIYLTRSGVQNEVALRGTQQLRSYITDTGDQKSFSFATNGNPTFVFSRPDGAVDLSMVHVGASGRNPFSGPQDFDFQLSAGNVADQGLAPLSDPGVYIGYNPGQGVWNYVVVPRDPAGFGFPSRGVIINSNAPITNLQAQGMQLNPSDAPDQLLINTGTRFTSQSIGAEIYGRNLAAGDFDNDGDVDIYVDQATPALNRANLLLVNQGNGTFVRTVAQGAAGPSLGTGGAVAAADYNRDGFLDIANLNGGSNPPFNALQDGPAQLYRNIPNGNHWLEVRLHGTDANADGIGAKVYITANGQTQFREMRNGQHIEAQDMQLVHFGLGANTTIDRLEVRWPNGQPTTVLNNVNADQILDVTQGQGAQPSDQLGLLFHPADGTLTFDVAAADPLGGDLLMLLGTTLALEGDGKAAAAEADAGIGTDSGGAAGEDTAFNLDGNGDAPVAADWLVG